MRPSRPVYSIRLQACILAAAALGTSIGCSSSSAPDSTVSVVSVAPSPQLTFQFEDGVLEMTRRIGQREVARLTAYVELRGSSRIVRLRMRCENGAALVLTTTTFGDVGAIEQGSASVDGGPPLVVIDQTRVRFEASSFDLGPTRAPSFARVDLARTLAGSPLGRALKDLLAYETALSARMSDLRPAFLFASLATDAPVPQVVDPDDRDPPGMLPGDQPGLGMTCSEAIKCPSTFPFCVKERRDAAFGSCTRTCASDLECASSSIRGSCTRPVSDIPGVAGLKLGCTVRCGTTCPGLLACTPGAEFCAAAN